MITAPLNIWIYYKGDNDELKKVQGGVFIDRWGSGEVKAQLNALVRDGILDSRENWIPGNRIVRVELIRDVIEIQVKHESGLTRAFAGMPIQSRIITED